MNPKPYPSDLTDQQWAILEPHLPPARTGGRPPARSPCLGWPDRSRDVSPYFLGPPDRVSPKSVVTM
jgi:transposase